MMILGSELNSTDREFVLDTEQNRMTEESLRTFPTSNIRRAYFTWTIITDKQWLASTMFPVDADGRLLKYAKIEHDYAKFRKNVKLGFRNAGVIVEAPVYKDPRLTVLDLDTMPANDNHLVMAYRKAVMKAFRAADCRDTAPEYVVEFEKITKAYNALKNSFACAA